MCMYVCVYKFAHLYICVLTIIIGSGGCSSIYLHIYVYISVSLMSCHLLLNLLHEPRIISCLPMNVIHLVINDNEFEILFIT